MTARLGRQLAPVQRIKVGQLLASPGEEYEVTPTQHLVLLDGRPSIVPAGTRYRSRWLEASHVLIVQIDPTLVEEAARTSLRGVASGIQLRREINACDEFLSHLILALRDALKADDFSARSYGDQLAITLAMHLVNRYAANAPGGRLPAGLPVNRMRRVAEHIDVHFDAPLSLRELAGVANMSVFHFARLFKARTGLSPHQYVLRKRVERAKQLLGDGSLTIAEIAARCGFSHQPHLTKAFHQFAGATPTEWRDRAV